MAQTTKIHDGKTKPIVVTDTLYPGGHFLGTVGTGGGGGGGGAVTVADGADTAQGTTTDAGVVTDTGGTAIGFLRGSIIQWISQLSRMGSLTETAPATDIASSGLNGRLQRVAQRLTSLIALLPAALTGSGNLKTAIVESTATVTTTGAGGTFPVTNANLDAALSTLLPTSDFDTKTGSLTETAPATDTASSGVNGRLQRVAQRLTALIALLPAALTGSGNLKAAIVESTATVTTTGVGGTFPVTNANLDAALSTLLPTTDFDTKTGSLTETAPGTDTASSGLNGRLQRLAQNITTLIAATLKVQGPGAAGAALTGNPNLVAVSDGTNAQTARQVTVNSTTFPGSGVGIQAVATGLYNGGSSWLANNSASNSSIDTNSLATSPNAAAYDFNATNWDRHRNNVDATLLASAARTTTQGPTTLTTYNLGAIIFVLDVTSAGTGSVTLTINEVDPASGKSILLLSGAAVTTNSTNVYIIDPMLTAAANSIAKNRVTRTLSWTLTANNANTLTGSLGAMELMP